jgi:hypothetical protein
MMLWIFKFIEIILFFRKVKKKINFTVVITISVKCRNSENALQQNFVLLIFPVITVQPYSILKKNTKYR